MTIRNIISRGQVDTLERGTDVIIAHSMNRLAEDIAMRELRAHISQSHPDLSAAIKRRNKARR